MIKLHIPHILGNTENRYTGEGGLLVANTYYTRSLGIDPVTRNRPGPISGVFLEILWCCLASQARPSALYWRALGSEVGSGL